MTFTLSNLYQSCLTEFNKDSGGVALFYPSQWIYTAKLVHSDIKHLQALSKLRFWAMQLSSKLQNDTVDGR